MSTSLSATRHKSHCPECGPDRWCDIIGQATSRWDDAGGLVSGGATHRLLECRGCETVFVEKMTWFSENTEDVQDPETGEWHLQPIEDYSYWPSPEEPVRKQPAWLSSLELAAVDGQLSDLFDEVYTALNHNALILAAIGLRTIFDRAAQLLGISADFRFAQKLEALVKSEKIGGVEKSILDVLTKAGNAAAHQGWRPAVDELRTLIEIAENFTYRTLILTAAAERVHANVPSKKKNIS